MTSRAEPPGLFAQLDEQLRLAVGAVAETDPDPADPFRGLYITDEQAITLAHAAPSAAAFEARLTALGRRLGLDCLDTAVLALCAAPELSPHYGRLYAYLHDDVTRRLPTPRLIARLLGAATGDEPAVLACLDREARLRAVGAVGILDEEATLPLQERPIRVAGRVVTELLGVALAAAELSDGWRRVDVPVHEVGRAQLVARLGSMATCGATLPIVIVGPDAAPLLAAALGRPLLVVGLTALQEPGAGTELALTCALEGRVPAYEGMERLAATDAPRALRAASAVADPPLLCARHAGDAAALRDVTVASVEVGEPTFAERAAAWRALSGCEDVRDVAAKFRLSIGDVGEAAAIARMVAAARGASEPEAADLDEGARRASRSGLLELARRLDGVVGWEDLVLPARQQGHLRSICSYLRHRDQVLSEWGYERTIARDQGVKALFAGESGTGKTLAAQVVAAELGLDLFRIDLAGVVSKYIGETEKNLDRVFAAAEGSNAILFFDEADALLGKRSDIGDAHDRYANIEVAYLLQRMETYPGAVVLATNLRQNIDEAFVRRLDFIIDFPFPEEDDRARLWRMLLPDAAPREDDLDVAFLASRFKLSGGAIRNCSVSAAFMAAEAQAPIGMDHLVRAVALEYGKLGRLTLESDFERFHHLVRHGEGNGGAPD